MAVTAVSAFGLAPPGAVAAPAATAPLGQQLVLFDPPATTGDLPLYGANQRIEVVGGFSVVANCLLGGTVDPGPVPIANSDIVAVGPGGEVRTSVSALGGLALGTSIGFTGPTGDYGTGTYDVYYDECQDGGYTPGVDPYFPRAFRVVVPVTASPIDLGETKEGARQVQETAAAVSTAYSVYGAVRDPFGAAVTGLAPSEVVLAVNLSEGDFVPDPVSLLIDQVAQNADLIAKDPPDPAYTQATTVPAGPAARAPEGASSSVVAALDSVDGAGRLAEALLHALERYQGAALAQDGYWALVHAAEIDQLGRALAATTTQAATDLDAVADEVAAQPGASPQLPATPFTEATARELRNAGLSPRQVGRLQARVAALGQIPSSTQVSASVQDLAAALRTWAPDLVDLAAQAVGSADALRDRSAIGPLPPTLQVAAPGAAPFGTAVEVRATGTGASADTGWDLDGDGDFDDARGPVAGFLAGSAGVVVPQARAAGPSGDSVVATAIVRVVGDPVDGGASAPSDTVLRTPRGTTTTFSVNGSSPTWTVDGVTRVRTSSFDYRPGGVAEIGAHRVGVTWTTTDGRPASRTWTVLVPGDDADGDSWTANVDCDEADADVNPGAVEVPANGVDDDCSTTTPDGGTGPTTISYDLAAADGGDRLALNGSAQLLDDRLRMTDVAVGGVASAWLRTPVDPAASFESTIDFALTGPDAVPADGLSLVVQSSAAGTAALGEGGGALGVSPIAPSVAVEFDTYDNGLSAGDPDANHAAIDRDAALGSPLAVGSLPTPLYNGGTKHTAVEYDAAGSTLSVWVWDDGSTRPVEPFLTASVDLAAVLGSANPAHVGLVSSTGGSRETADVLGWTFLGAGAPPTPGTPLAVDQLDLETATGVPARGSVALPEGADGLVVVEPPLHGTVTVEGQDVVYTPEPLFTGDDVFAFAAEAADGARGAPAIGSVAVLGGSAAPVLDAVRALSGPEDAAPVLATGEDPADIRLALTGLPGFVTLVDRGDGRGVVSVDASRSDASPGTYTGAVVATDGRGTTSTPVTVVLPGNQSPVVDSLRIASPDGAPVSAVFGPLDGDGDDIAAQVVYPPAHGAVVLDGYTAVHVPEEGFSGVDGFIVSFSDGTASAPAAALVDVSRPAGGGDPVPPVPGTPDPGSPAPGSPAPGSQDPTAHPLPGTSARGAHEVPGVAGALARTGGPLVALAALGLAATVGGSALSAAARRRSRS